MVSPNLSPTTLAQFVRLENCDRFLRFRLVPEDAERLQRKWNLTIQPLTPLLRESGAEFEQDIAARLAARGEKVIDLSGHDFNETMRVLKTIESPTLLFQAALEGALGNYNCAGRADILRVRRDRRGRLQVLVADIKATRQEKTEHRLQVAVYAYLVQSLALESGLALGKLSGAVITRSPEGIYEPFSGGIPIFELETYFRIIERLALEDDSTVRRVLNAPFDAVFFHLGPKCDGCLYNALCMYDAAERLDLALTPQISPVEKRILIDAGVTRLDQLAGLMKLPAPRETNMQPDPSHQEIIERLRNRWPVAANLSFLVQRAKAALRHFIPQSEHRLFLYGAGFGSLPSDTLYPTLVKVFFDAQRDYLQDRIYMLSACVVGPHGRETVIELTDGPPGETHEAKILLSWIAGVFDAVHRVARSDEAPLHLYCYSRYDQKMLLDAFKRNLTTVAAVPAVFNLMTQRQAFNQQLITFLADELQERANPGRMCMPLHDAARWRGFDWKDERYEYFRLFQARMFDNRREVVRLEDGRLAPASAYPLDDPRRFSIECASRFNSQIPLEYAYAAWGRLPDSGEDGRMLDSFRRVNLEMLRGFGRARAEALAFIEDSFKSKSKAIEKPALNLPGIFGEPVALDARSNFQRSLKEFLYMEHHSRLQSLFTIYRWPIERRVQAGMALLLKFNHGSIGGQYVFSPDFETLGLDAEITLNTCKLKEGDWVVINPLHPTPSAGQIKHGRLAVIQSLSPENVTLHLLDLNFHNGYFRYSHQVHLEPRTGLSFTLDPMCDDLIADKVLDALDQIENNLLFTWLLEKPTFSGDQAFMNKFGDYVANLIRQSGRSLTERQREVITAQSAQPLLLVQGPPGTGKSYTLAWAIMANIAAAAVQGCPCRVLVACKTHNAIRIVLDAFASAQKQVGVSAPSQLGGQGIFGTEIYKVMSEAGEDLPEGVRSLHVYDQRSGIANLLAKRFVVIGATPGGVYNLMRYQEAGGNEIAWEHKTFDLVVVDEGSQMSLPEGILTGAFLKSSGRMIVAGDHRQMPPIIAHDWKDDQKHAIVRDRPFISLFEALMERDFPIVGLDESFRLHHEIAEFLHENIYARDGIRFHSRRKELVQRVSSHSDFANAVLDPRYPIVVVEHTEAASQQYNLTELELVRPLINACLQHLQLDGRNGIGVVVPHRTQKALLRKEFPELADANSIDTVERFQGDERDLIIVSATASDPDYVRGEADFLLNLNRLNVAISRPRKKLIVVASQSVINLLTSDIDVFEQSLIWKRLYHHFTPEVLLRSSLNGYTLIVRGRRSRI